MPMIPFTYPITGLGQANKNDKVVVFELTSTTGLVPWKDYIPAAVRAVPVATDRNRTNDAGYLGFYFLASNTGLVAWKDYIPVDTVVFAQAGAWKAGDAAGFIPYVDETV